MKVENQRIDFDLVAEQLQPRRPVLGGPEDVEDPAPDRELPPLLHLVDALVAGLDQQIGDLAEVDLGAALEREARRAKRRVGHRLGERHGAGDDHRGIGVGERVQRRDPQADEMRRRRHVGGVAGAPRRVVADGARRQVGAQLAGQVARPDVVGRHHQHRPAAEPLLRLRERRQQVGLDGGRYVHGRRAALADGARQRAEPLVVRGDLQQGAKAHFRRLDPRACMATNRTRRSGNRHRASARPDLDSRMRCPDEQDPVLLREHAGRLHRRERRHDRLAAQVPGAASKGMASSRSRAPTTASTKAWER